MSWNDGYVVDVPYTEHAYREMTPSWLSLTSVLNRQPPLDTGRPFTYIELGCGRGLTANTIAASNPSAEVWACDFNPSHIERAHQLAAAAALQNCSFVEASFEELTRDAIGPAQADVIGLHGIYSWISRANRRHVVDIIRRRLVPGGLVYVSYDVPTGWAALQPIQQAMRLQADTDHRRSDVAIRSALATITQLAEDGARSFPLPPREQAVLDGLPQSDPAYVAHEYLGGSFTPLMFAEVAAELSAAKCDYVGSTFLPDAFIDLRVPGELFDLVSSAPDLARRETICDLGNQKMFRGDVFRRGLAHVTGPDHRRHLNALQLVTSGTAFDATTQVATSVGTVQLDADHFGPLVERVLEAAVTVEELRASAVLEGQSDDQVSRSVALLVAGGYALPTSPNWERNGAVESVGRLNRALLDASQRGDLRGILLSPATGGVVGLSPLVALAIGEHWNGVPLVEDALATALASRAASLQLPLFKGSVALTEEEVGEEVRRAAQQAVRLSSGLFSTLGIRATTGRRVPPGRKRGRVERPVA